MSDHDASRSDPRQPACPVKPKWLRRFGLAAFLFFLIKGLLWLIIPAGLAALAYMKGA